MLGELDEVGAAAVDANAIAKDAKVAGALAKFIENPSVQAFCKRIGLDGEKIAEGLEKEGLSYLKELAKSPEGKQLLENLKDLGTKAAALTTVVTTVGAAIKGTYDKASDAIDDRFGRVQASVDGGRASDLTTSITGRILDATGNHATLQDAKGHIVQLTDLRPENVAMLGHYVGSATPVTVSLNTADHRQITALPNDSTPVQAPQGSLRPSLSFGSDENTADIRGAVSGKVIGFGVDKNGEKSVTMEKRGMGEFTVHHLPPDVYNVVQEAWSKDPSATVQVSVNPNGSSQARVASQQQTPARTH